MNVRIGILQCDHVDKELVGIDGDYNDMFSDLLYAQEDSFEYELDMELAVYDLTANHFPINLNACDAYLITGSKFSVYDAKDDVPWLQKAKDLVVKLYNAKIPTIGICFGHQLIAESLGGKVKKAADKGWGVGVQQWEIKKQKDWMGDKNLTELSLRASHQDQVVELPPNATLIVSSAFCPIAGFHTGNHFLSFQGHPEFSKEYSAALLEKRVLHIGEETTNTAKQSLQKAVDNEIVAKWILNFLKQS